MGVQMMIRASVLSKKLRCLLCNQGTKAKTAGQHPGQKSKQIRSNLLEPSARKTSARLSLQSPRHGRMHDSGLAEVRNLLMQPR